MCILKNQCIENWYIKMIKSSLNRSMHLKEIRAKILSAKDQVKKETGVVEAMSLR